VKTGRAVIALSSARRAATHARYVRLTFGLTGSFRKGFVKRVARPPTFDRRARGVRGEGVRRAGLPGRPAAGVVADRRPNDAHFFSRVVRPAIRHDAARRFATPVESVTSARSAFFAVALGRGGYHERPSATGVNCAQLRF
jgi:hypothetical protein